MIDLLEDILGYACVITLASIVVIALATFWGLVGFIIYSVVF